MQTTLKENAHGFTAVDNLNHLCSHHPNGHASDAKWREKLDINGRGRHLLGTLSMSCQSTQVRNNMLYW